MNSDEADGTDVACEEDGSWICAVDAGSSRKICTRTAGRKKCGRGRWNREMPGSSDAVKLGTRGRMDSEASRDAGLHADELEMELITCAGMIMNPGICCCSGTWRITRGRSGIWEARGCWVDWFGRNASWDADRLGLNAWDWLEHVGADVAGTRVQDGFTSREEGLLVLGLRCRRSWVARDAGKGK